MSALVVAARPERVTPTTPAFNILSVKVCAVVASPSERPTFTFSMLPKVNPAMAALAAIVPDRFKVSVPPAPTILSPVVSVVVSALNVSLPLVPVNAEPESRLVVSVEIPPS
jgi:hypothetical protein